MMKRFTFLFAFLMIGIQCLAAFGQDSREFDFYARGPYKSEVPRPQSILRFDIGKQHTTYAQMEMVIQAIEKSAPERVRIFDIGLTNENRMQHVVAISSPSNMARLDQLKEANTRLTDPRKTNSAAAAQIAKDNPVFAWMAYTIHGNESASFEAMMQVVYHLAASNEPATLDILDNTVVLVVTGENPDGHERFATWYNSVAVGDPNPAAFEHREPWSIQGRYNRYRFDLNRDNVVLTQKETVNMNRAFFEWNPQISVDHHGQPSQFFFPPAADPINPNLPQPATNKWLDIFGRANARSFDENGWDYYVRDIFDLFYVGYWDSMPSLNGAIGMTYETDGGGFKGLNWRRDDGTIATLHSAIAKHYVASLTTLETAAKNRTARLRDFYDFRAGGMAEVQKSPLKRIVLIPDSDPVKAAELADVLLTSRIEVKIAKTSFSSSTAHTYMMKDALRQSKTFPAGSYVIDLNQPQTRWIKSLLEQDTPQNAGFVAENVARFNRNELRGTNAVKEDYGFYDITAWNPPLTFGIDAYWTEESSAISADDLTTANLRNIKASISNFARGRTAYVLPYETDTAVSLAIRLMQEGFRVNVATKKLYAAGRYFEPGAFVVRVTRNPETVHDAIRLLSAELGAKVVPVNTGYTEEGDTGVGGEYVFSLTAPKIAMVSDEQVSQSSYGSTWWMLDKSGIKFTPLTIGRIKSGALRDYNVLIIPDGSAGAIFGEFGAGGIEALKEWISNGGTLVTMRGSSVFATLKDVGFSTSELVGSGEMGPLEDDKRGSEPRKEMPDKAIEIPMLPPVTSPTANRGRVPEGVPGAIMRARVDRTTYLNYGVNQDEIPVLLASGYFFGYSKKGNNALIFDGNSTNPLTISGFVWEGNTERLLNGTACLIDERVGGGHVIMFSEDVFFRGIFRSTTRQFFNAIAFNGTF